MMDNILNAPLPLLPIDYVFTGENSYQIEFVFVFNYRIDANRLKDALDKLLVSFYPLRSKLKKIPPDDLAIAPANDGFVYEVIESTEKTFSADPHVYLNTVVTMENEPLGKLRLTQTPAGSVLGISIAHFVADGFSTFYFLGELAKAYQNKEITPPEIKRSWFTSQRAQSKEKITAEDIIRQTGFSGPFPRKEVSRDRIVWENITVPNDKIQQILADAQKESSIRLTKNDVLSAYLSKTYITRWQNDKPLDKAYITSPFDIRRFSDLVSGNYFGNGICLMTVEMEYDWFLKASVSRLAQKIRATINKINKEYVINYYNVMEQYRHQEGLLKMQQLHVAHPYAGILATNLSRVPLELCDFGQGKPTRFMALTPSPRGAIMLPGQNGIKVDVCFPFFSNTDKMT